MKISILNAWLQRCWAGKNLLQTLRCRASSFSYINQDKNLSTYCSADFLLKCSSCKQKVLFVAHVTISCEKLLNFQARSKLFRLSVFWKTFWQHISWQKHVPQINNFHGKIPSAKNHFKTKESTSFQFQQMIMKVEQKRRQKKAFTRKFTIESSLLHQVSNYLQAFATKRRKKT